MARKLVNYRLPESLLYGLKERAEREGVSVTDLVIRYCEQGLESVGTNVVTDVNTNVKTVPTEQLYSIVNDAIAPLQQQLEQLKTELGEFVA